MTKTTVFAHGKVYWAKIVGEKAAVQNYEKDGYEWAFEFVPDDTTFLKEHKLLDRLKDKPDPKNPEKGDFIYLKKPTLTKDGAKNDPFRIYDENDQPWDDRLIGNGSEVDVKLAIHDWGVGKKKSIYTTAIRVTSLVPYVQDEFGGMNKGAAAGTAKPEKAKAKPSFELDELDDDVPFEK